MGLVLRNARTRSDRESSTIPMGALVRRHAFLKAVPGGCNSWARMIRRSFKDFVREPAEPLALRGWDDGSVTRKRGLLLGKARDRRSFLKHPWELLTPLIMNVCTAVTI